MNKLITYNNTPQPTENNSVLNKNSVSTTTEKETWTVKEKIVYGLLSVIGVGGTIWIGKTMIQKFNSNREENKSFEDGSPATIAKQIKMAFDNDGWWGTNTILLRETLLSVSSQTDWDSVVKSYSKLYNSNLLKDLADELQSTEYNEMLQIINSKPLKKGQVAQGIQYNAWAKRLKAAFDKEYGFLPGTDDNAITTTLNEMQTQSAFIKTGVQYKTLYGKNVLDDLKAEAEFGQYDEWISIITKKRKS